LDPTHQEHKALAICIEHRFYGKSIPFGNRSVANLKYLTVEQHLADTAAIVKAVQGNLTKKRPVVAVGGSYSGALSAWFRQTYPDVADAAIANSGVVHAIVNFTAFDDQIAKAVDLPVPGCASVMKLYVSAMEGEFKAGKGDEVKTMMNATNLIGTVMGEWDDWCDEWVGCEGYEE
jgi:pimeloyl-ACP methyl ester carboxylesterase